ncbi:MAG: hypothetical protein JJ900_15720 [Rhodospirillales bacterium]|nr:hypothetical protein [Rhodospirillales bacterium]MBO6788296.1 hypothetical protein [Rhodospirillales bacterium]
MKDFKRRFLAMVVLAAIVVGGGPRVEADMPNEEQRDILILATLMRFNDANLSGNYSILHGLAAKPFRERNSVQMVADAFEEFRDRNVRIEEILLRDIQPHDDGETMHDGVLRLSGDIEMSRYRMTYHLRFLSENGEWKLYAIDMDLR